MSDPWVFHDGQRLTPAMLQDFLALDADFARRTGGVHLKIRSGVRTDAEQERFWYDRMVLAHQVRGRRVYETRWWNGQLWYRISSAGTVAPPKQSNHQIDVAAGRRGALDLYDTGSDAGILTRGSFRANVFDQIAPFYGYDSEGYAFAETWHKRYNRDPWRRVASSAATAAPKESDNMQSISINGNLYGVDTEFITHYGTLLQAKVTREVTSVADELHDLNKAYGNRANEAWAELLDGLGIPRNVIDGKGRVLNPQSTAVKPEDRFEGNGTWSRRREILARVADLDKRIAALAKS